MKRHILIALSLALVLLLSIAGSAVPVQAASPFLIINGDFESGDTGWEVFQTENGVANAVFPSNEYNNYAIFETCNSTSTDTWEGGGISQTFYAPAGTWILSLNVGAYTLDYSILDGHGPKIEVIIDDVVIRDHTFVVVRKPYPGSPIANWTPSVSVNFPEDGSHEIKIRITTKPWSEPLIRTIIDNVKLHKMSLLDGEPVYEYGGHYYLVVPGAITWEQANTAADRGGMIDGTYYQGYLATITSAEENAFIYDLLGWTSGSGGRGWIGGYQLPDQASTLAGWQWVTDEDMSYTNWDPAYSDSPIPSPNDAGGPLSGDPPTAEVPNPAYYGLEDNGENYMEMRGRGYWDDLGAINNSSYVIEFEPRYELTIATEPAGIAGTTGSGQYKEGETVDIFAPENVDINAGQSRYHFTGWTGDGVTFADTSAPSTTIIMPECATTVTANYETQYKVTFAQSGIGDDTQDTVVTIDGVAKTKAELPFTTDWITSGTSLTYAYASPLDRYNGFGSLIINKRYIWDSTSGLSQTQQSDTLSVTDAGTVTAAYREQYLLIFDVFGIGIKEDYSNTILTLNGVGKTGNELPINIWLGAGDSLSYEFEDVVYGTSGTKYVWLRNVATPNLNERSTTLEVTSPGRAFGLYCGSIVTVSPDSEQYSDTVEFNLSVSLCPEVTPETEVHFYIGTQDMGTAALGPRVESTQSASLTVPLLETVSGELAAGNKVVTAKFNNSDTVYNPTTSLAITREDAEMTFASDDTSVNPTAVQVGAPSGNSGTFSFEIRITQADDSWPGDIGLINPANVSISLDPVGPGSPITQTGSSISTDPSGTRIVTFNFNDIPVNTYGVTATLRNDYFAGDPIDTVLTVYDPSLGFTTGGGFFYWPNTADPVNDYPGDKTNFGYSMQYDKKGVNLKGGLILIRHHQNGDIYRIKSNALDAGSLALGTTDLPMGWATFSGKCTFTSILSDLATTFGNIQFNVYVEDRNEPGTLADRFWIQVTGYPELCLTAPPADNGISISGGNIMVPHVTGVKEK